MIYTFYSFKGGVGRSMALANVAERLCDEGLNVLMIDFDLEAPGLERFFSVPGIETTPQEVLSHRGIMDMLLSYKVLRSSPPRNPPQPEQEEPEQAPAQSPIIMEPLSLFVAPLYKASEEPNELGVKRGSLSIIPAGRRDGKEFSNYAKRLRSFDWEDFYDNWDGARFFEWFREQAEALADVVLIDSRTGVTEMSGVCTYQLADVVVMFVAPNQQNLDGILTVAKSLSNPELVEKGRGGRPLSLVFVPSRVEQQAESTLLDQFAEQFESLLSNFIKPELKFEKSMFLDLKIPYVAYYSFMENVAMRERERASAADMIAAFERLCSILLQLKPASEEPEGALSPESSFYIEREPDRMSQKVIKNHESPTAIQGPRQVGKSSLLKRMLAEAEAENKRTVLLDFTELDQEALSDANIFFRQFCTWLTTELGLEDHVDDFWPSNVPLTRRCTAYFEKYIFPQLDSPLVLAIDQVDMLFGAKFRSDFFAMLRAWHNLRSSVSAWKKLILILVTSIEPYALVTDRTRSPFNVAKNNFVLADFTPEQVSELNRRYGNPLDPKEESDLTKLLGGVPYLVHQALYKVAKERYPKSELLSKSAHEGDHLFADHLRKLPSRLGDNQEMRDALRQVVTTRTCPTEQLFMRLYCAGLVRGQNKDAAFARCQLYEDYFREYFHVSS